MAGFWSRLLGRAGNRPVIAQEASADPERLNDVVDWFLTNEEAIRRHESMVLHALLLLGYSSRNTAGSRADLRYSDGIEFCGLRNQTTFYIWRQLAAIRDTDGGIREEKMSALLEAISQNLRDIVIHLREYDRSGDELVRFLHVAEPLAAAFVGEPDPTQAVSAFRARFETDVFRDERRRHIAALFVGKSFSEIAFYLLCWLYYSWYGRQFYAPPLE